MNLGQTLISILALMLFSTITLSINRVRIGAAEQTIENQIELAAINYGQSLVETVSKVATTEQGFENLETIYDNWEGTKSIEGYQDRKLYSLIEVETSAGMIYEGIQYKKVTVLIFSEPSRDDISLKSRFKASFAEWW